MYKNHCKNTFDSGKAAREQGLNHIVMKICFKLTDVYKDLITLSGRSAPRDGAYVHGMYMEGARWDIQQGVILDSRLKELFPHMPVINIRVRFTTHPYQGLPSFVTMYHLHCADDFGIPLPGFVVVREQEPGTRSLSLGKSFKIVTFNAFWAHYFFIYLLKK